MTLPGPLVGWGGGAGEGDSLPHYSLPPLRFRRLAVGAKCYTHVPYLCYLSPDPGD